MDILDEVLQDNLIFDNTQHDTSFNKRDFLSEINSKLRKPITVHVLNNHLRTLGLKPVSYGRYCVSDLYVIRAWINRDPNSMINGNIKKDFMEIKGRIIKQAAQQNLVMALKRWQANTTIEVKAE